MLTIFLKRPVSGCGTLCLTTKRDTQRAGLGFFFAHLLMNCTTVVEVTEHRHTSCQSSCAVRRIKKGQRGVVKHSSKERFSLFPWVESRSSCIFSAFMGRKSTSVLLVQNCSLLSPFTWTGRVCVCVHVFTCVRA